MSHISAPLVAVPLAPRKSLSLHRNVFQPIRSPVAKRDRAARPTRLRDPSRSSKEPQQSSTMTRRETQLVARWMTQCIEHGAARHAAWRVVPHPAQLRPTRPLEFPNEIATPAELRELASLPARSFRDDTVAPPCPVILPRKLRPNRSQPALDHSADTAAGAADGNGVFCLRAATRAPSSSVKMRG